MWCASALLNVVLLRAPRVGLCVFKRIFVCVCAFCFCVVCVGIVCVQKELAAMASGVCGDTLDAVSGLRTEQQGSEYMADCVNKAMGRKLVHVPHAGAVANPVVSLD